jgi:hypothetical protein
MNHQGERHPDILRRRSIWWQPILILMAVVSCGLLIGMTGGESPPICESGGPCGAEAFFQETIFWEDEGVVCGNGWCDPGEGVWNCPADCSECGDTVCRPEEVDTCPEDCPVSVTCGDGICSAFENNEACPQDCAAITPTSTPRPPTSTPTPRPSGGGSEEQVASATPRPTRTPTETPEEEEVEEPEEELTETEAEQPEQEETTTEASCSLVDVNNLPGNLVDTFNLYNSSGSPHLFTSCQALPKEICVALESGVDIPDTVLDVPGRVLLRREGESNISIDDLGVVNLTYCAAGSECISYPPTSFDQALNLICFSVGDQELVPVCTDGCTFALYKSTGQQATKPPTEVGTSQPTDQPVVSPVLLVILLGVLILAVVALIVFLVLANRPSRT